MAIKKPSIHAPWRNRILIPIWIIQLGFSAFLTAWTILIVWIAVYSGPDSGVSQAELAIYAISLVLMFILMATTIYTIIKYARFTLTTMSFRRTSIYAVIASIISTSMHFAIGDWFIGIFPSILVVVAILELWYSIRTRRRVLKGLGTEMVKPAKKARKSLDVELGEATRRVQNGHANGEAPPATDQWEIPKAGFDVAERQSSSSAVTGGEAAEPSKPRSFL